MAKNEYGYREDPEAELIQAVAIAAIRYFNNFDDKILTSQQCAKVQDDALRIFGTAVAIILRNEQSPEDILEDLIMHIKRKIKEKSPVN